MLGLDVLDTTDHVERVLRDVVVLTVEDLLESVDGLLEGDKSTLNTGEDLSDSERLRHESLVISVSFGSPHGLSGILTWIFRARSTVNLSSSDNSSIPRMAMISWRDL